MHEISLLEEPEVVRYLEVHQLVKAYRKVKQQLKSGYKKQTKLRKRQPKHENIWYFRITKKYRAIGYFYDAMTFVVTEISDHQ